MEDLFRSYWWLLFPMAWFVVGAFSSFLNYRRQRETLNLLKTYAERGQEPPEALLKVLDRPIDSETEFWNGRSNRNGASEGQWFSVVLFGLLAAGFGYASWSDMYGAGQAFLIVAFVLGSLCLACLVSALMRRGRARKG
ncbi:MAG: hypothetical protein KF910_02275 [Brevundimonas sp.]|uniref:hypothetical protein n=1 Tax=Brevundimonas sp. TaxID=1871086 RepID=UPI0025C4036A|nr:hypothetical protein [Brevundimonas sp.]MBX3476410.1 hypothetical protein [Brevundimonas sp.]